MFTFVSGLMLFAGPVSAEAQSYYVRKVVRNGRVRYVRVRKPSYYRRHRNRINMGIGTAGGAIIGGLIGGGKGALIGGILGAGGGFLGEKLTKGPEAEVKSGTEFGVYMNQAISLPRFVETNPVTP